ncbi:opacity protein-like surface antigen [Elusimicrobium simillimum]|uniref:outer membrane beta-barrel protein n=1 Tax=Elusimicrobium simillimum TaxID=3143438 RepID=UPI003C7056D8
MKKLLLFVCMFALAVSVSYAHDFGIGIKGGFTQKDTKLDDLKDWAQDNGAISTSLDENNGFWGLELFYEHQLNDRAFLGIKAGYEGLGKDELDFTILPYKYSLEMTGYVIPLTIYYKYYLTEKVNIWGGGGVAMLFGQLKDNGEKFKEHKVYPHVDAGVEWRMSPNVGLGLDARYSFSSEIDDFIDVPNLPNPQLDVDGLSAGVALRLYF